MSFSSRTRIQTASRLNPIRFSVIQDGISFANPESKVTRISRSLVTASKEDHSWQSCIHVRRLLFWPRLCFSGLIQRALRRITDSSKIWNSSNSRNRSTSSSASNSKTSCSSDSTKFSAGRKGKCNGSSNQMIGNNK